MCLQQTVEWYIDGQKFEKTSAISWRIRINPEKQLEVRSILFPHFLKLILFEYVQLLSEFFEEENDCIHKIRVVERFLMAIYEQHRIHVLVILFEMIYATIITSLVLICNSLEECLSFFSLYQKE